MKPWSSVVLIVVAATLTSRADAASCATGSSVPVSSVDRVFRSGSRWRLNVERCSREGLVFSNVRFTPKGGVERIVLQQANIAQLHVPYHPGEPRFHDLTTATPGLGALALTLAAAECPQGVLLDGGRVCQEVQDRGHAWKFQGRYAMGEELVIWMSSQLGAYNYINLWSFQDDGTIEPRVGLTGRLQMIEQSASFLPYGARLNPESEPTPSVGINHLHNVYYRLDFDIGGPTNDAVERIEYFQSFTPSPDSACAIPGECGVDVPTLLDQEAVDFLDPDHYTSWRVFDKALRNRDGRTIGYEIVPSVEGLWSGMSGGSEPWSSGELWITRFNGCELLAFDNQSPFLPSVCSSSTPSSVSTMVDGASIDGADLVVWYVNRFRHFVRDEDQPDMPVEWLDFRIAPRNFFHQNPME